MGFYVDTVMKEHVWFLHSYTFSFFFVVFCFVLFLFSTSPGVGQQLQKLKVPPEE